MFQSISLPLAPNPPLSPTATVQTPSQTIYAPCLHGVDKKPVSGVDMCAKYTSKFRRISRRQDHSIRYLETCADDVLLDVASATFRYWKGHITLHFAILTASGHLWANEMNGFSLNASWDWLAFLGPLKTVIQARREDCARRHLPPETMQIYQRAYRPECEQDVFS